jgi:hypothetical protein
MPKEYAIAAGLTCGYKCTAQIRTTVRGAHERKDSKLTSPQLGTWKVAYTRQSEYLYKKVGEFARVVVFYCYTAAFQIKLATPLNLARITFRQHERSNHSHCLDRQDVRGGDCGHRGFEAGIRRSVCSPVRHQDKKDVDSSCHKHEPDIFHSTQSSTSSAPSKKPPRNCPSS